MTASLSPAERTTSATETDGDVVVAGVAAYHRLQHSAFRVLDRAAAVARARGGTVITRVDLIDGLPDAGPVDDGESALPFAADTLLVLARAGELATRGRIEDTHLREALLEVAL